MDRTLLTQALTKFLAGIILAGLLVFLPAGSFAYWQGRLLMGVLFIPMFFPAPRKPLSEQPERGFAIKNLPKTLPHYQFCHTKIKKRLTVTCKPLFLRRGRDSNPRTREGQQFSRLPQSTTLPPLQDLCIPKGMQRYK